MVRQRLIEDDFVIYKKGSGTGLSAEPGDTSVELKKTGIVWSGLKGNRFKKDGDGSTQWVDVESGEFFLTG
jgi:hypothetical protein